MNNLKINVVTLSEVLRRTQLGQNVKVELHFALSLSSVVLNINVKCLFKNYWFYLLILLEGKEAYRNK